MRCLIFILSACTYLVGPPAAAQGFTLNGIDYATNEAIVTTARGETFRLNLGTFNTKAKVITEIQKRDLTKPTPPAPIVPLVGKTFDPAGNEIP